MPINFNDLRLPLECRVDLTYRCNNNCVHCWLRISPADAAGERELSFDEIRKVVDEARALGTQRWSISGGEPMLRPDFAEIFDYITAKAITYTLNTNGTLITPELARLLKRKGVKMVALYGATRETYDHVTRNPGGFDQVMQGVRYLREAGVGFTVQLVPMRDNWHEWDKMKELATSLSSHWRVGAPWLNLSSCRDPQINAEIARQRLDPRDIVELDKPDVTFQERAMVEARAHECVCTEGDGRLFSGCIASRREFHVDPYGGMTFCSYIKEPSMRYNVRTGNVRQGWEEFIPSLSERVFNGAEYREKCGSCDLRAECNWCGVYGWLEHGSFSAPVEYLCDIARERRHFKEEWLVNNRRYFRIADITIRVDSDLPMNDHTFHERFALFSVDGPGEDMVTIRHHYTLPDLSDREHWQELYHKSPWAIYRKKGSYIYLGISPMADNTTPHRVMTSNEGHTRVTIYNNCDVAWQKGNLHSLTMFATDQILIARLLADRQGCYLHSAGAILDGAGVLFVGHSDAGKSTVTNLLIDAGAKGEMAVEILCDDRNIVRRMNDGWRVYGTWSHGDVPLVSSSGAPLRAVCFLEKAGENTLMPLTDRKEIVHRLLACVVRPFVTSDWWEKTLSLVESMGQELPCYVMRFDKTSGIISELRDMIVLK